MVQIEIQNGPDAGKTIELAVGHHSVGRASTNDVVVSANSVSGNHLQLSVDANETVSFEDLGSTNGTFSGGMKVLQGEWFPGSELKLGDITLKLIESVDDHQRLRQEALDAPKSSILLKVAAMVVVVGGGGFAYLQFFESKNANLADTSAADNPAIATNTIGYDLIDNLGDFADSEDWQLSKGATIAQSKLSASVAAKASLSRVFQIESPSLELQADVSGTVMFEAAWGSDDAQEKVLATWSSSINSKPTTMSLPPLAKWMKISVQLDAGSSIAALRVNASDSKAQSSSMSMGKAYYDGGNLAVVVNDELAFSLSSTSGRWQVDSEKAMLEGGDLSTISMNVGPDFLTDESRLMVLADGGPIIPSVNMTIDNPAGLLCGTQIDSYFFEFDGASSITGNLVKLKVAAAPVFSFVWDMREPLTQAAREMQTINSALNAGDDSLLLTACQRLLRRYPIKDENVSRAMMLVRETMARGHRELGDLQQQASGALFVGASQVMVQLEESAQELGKRFRGTDIAVQADSLSQLLRDVVAQDANELSAERQEYYLRVVKAVEPVYPQISAWLAREAN